MFFKIVGTQSFHDSGKYGYEVQVEINVIKDK